MIKTAMQVRTENVKSLCFIFKSPIGDGFLFFLLVSLAALLHYSLTIVLLTVNEYMKDHIFELRRKI